MAGRTSKFNTVKYPDHYTVVFIGVTTVVGFMQGFWVKGNQEVVGNSVSEGRKPGARIGVGQSRGVCFLNRPSPCLTIDTPNIVVPLEVVAGTEVEVSCMVPDNCPELRPELSWLGHDGLGEPAVLGRLREDEGTWVQVSLLHFVPTREANGHRLGCQASFLNTTLQFEGYASLDVKCEPGCGRGAGAGRGRQSSVPGAGPAAQAC